METFLLFFLILFVVAAFGYSYYQLDKSYRNIYKVAIPFKESLDLTGLPVVTFDNHGVKLRLLIDSGSDASIIDSKALEMCMINGVKGSNTQLVTGGGALDSDAIAIIPISYKDLDFEGEFLICDMEEQFRNAFGNKIHVHGLLGSNFFRKYKYKIDYSDLAVYARK